MKNKPSTWVTVKYKDDAFDHGLVLVPHYSVNANTLLDALHHIVNPPEYYNKNGTLKKGFFGMLRRRLRSNTLRPSWVTQHMLDVAVTVATQEMENIVPPDDGLPVTIETVFSIHDLPSWGFYKDALTNQYHVDGTHRRVRLGTLGWAHINKLTDPRNYGYTFNERNDIWLTSNQFYHDGNVYNRDEVSIAETK